MNTTTATHTTKDGIEMFWSSELQDWVTIPDREYCEHGLETGSCPMEQGE